MSTPSTLARSRHLLAAKQSCSERFVQGSEANSLQECLHWPCTWCCMLEEDNLCLQTKNFILENLFSPIRTIKYSYFKNIVLLILQLLGILNHQEVSTSNGFFSPEHKSHKTHKQNKETKNKTITTTTNTPPWHQNNETLKRKPSETQCSFLFFFRYTTT